MKQKLLSNFSIRCAAFALCLATGTTVAQAQARLEGSVMDSNGNPLVGATVVVEGTSEGTTTGIDGSFLINSKSFDRASSKLQVAYMGYVTQSVPYSNGEINVMLTDDSQQLDEVVVTALGIKRQEKALGYATQSVDGEEITKAMTKNWSSALNGKVAGLTLVTSGGAVGSTQISLRGNVSLNSDSNGALIIIDGVPLSDDMVNDGDAYGAGSTGDASLDYGNAFNDLNPNDIENVQVLKGATAAALYGTRAANGVVLITTKSGGSKGRGVEVSFNSNFSVETVANLPDFQYQFGQGNSEVGSPSSSYPYQPYYSYGVDAANDLAATSTTCSAWGPQFLGQMYYQYDPTTQSRGLTPTEWVGYENNRKDLFQTGTTFTNSVAISNSTDKGSVRASITHTSSSWILPNTDSKRIQASLSAQQNLSDRLKLSFKTGYTNKQIDNVPALSYSGNSISYFMIFQTPSFDLEWLAPTWASGQEGVQQLLPFSTYFGNPYLTLYENENPQNKHAVISSANISYKITDKLNFMVRSALSMESEQRESHRAISDRSNLTGAFSKTNIFNYETNSDFLLSYNNQINDISISANVGGNVMYSYYDYLKAQVTGLAIPGVYALTNGLSATNVSTIINEKAVNSLYFTAGASYKDYIFFDVTGRNDWSSTLSAANRSFFYPSVSLSTLVDQYVEMPNMIDMLKVRMSYASVGNDTTPYKTSSYYNNSDFISSVTLPSNLYNQDLKPEISSSFEIGTDIRMFQNRLGVDLTYYNSKTKNQIISAGLDITSGYSSTTINAGAIRNSGVELSINAVPVKKRDLTWRVMFNWSKNTNKILSLSGKGDDETMVISSVGSASIIATVGGSSGDLYGYKVKRTADGTPIISSTGLPELTDDIEYVGNANPDWKGSVSSQLTYKGLSFSMQFDGQMGGIIYSHSHHKMSEQGKLTNTLNGRLPGSEYYMTAAQVRATGQHNNDTSFIPADGIYMIAPGVVDNGNGVYTPNEKVVTVKNYYSSYYKMANVETNSFDASFLKIREIRLDYDLSQVKSIANSSILKSLTVGVYGSNLFCFTDYPLYDPEFSTLSGSSMVSGIETGTLPSSRTFGVNVGVTF